MIPGMEGDKLPHGTCHHHIYRVELRVMSKKRVRYPPRTKSAVEYKFHFVLGRIEPTDGRVSDSPGDRTYETVKRGNYKTSQDWEVRKCEREHTSRDEHKKCEIPEYKVPITVFKIWGPRK